MLITTAARARSHLADALHAIERLAMDQLIARQALAATVAATPPRRGVTHPGRAAPAWRAYGETCASGAARTGAL